MAVQIRKGDKLGRLEKSLDNPARALKQIGVLMVAASQQAFRDQRLGDVAWKPRGRINIFGLIADFAAGRTPPARRFESAPVLIDTGRLASSIASRIVGRDSVEAGTTVSYAAVHQTGGEVESETITEQVRQNLAEWLRGKGSAYQKRVGWLLARKFAGTRLKGKVPARPFLGLTDELLDDIREVVGVEITEGR